jgi:hypothetical protein
MSRIVRLTERDLTRLVRRIIKEEAEERVIIKIKTNSYDINYVGQLGRKPNRDLYYFKPEEGGFEIISYGAIDDRSARLEKQRFDSLVGKYLEVDYEGGAIQLGSRGNRGNMFIAGLIRGETGVIIEKI